MKIERIGPWVAVTDDRGCRGAWFLAAQVLEVAETANREVSVYFLNGTRLRLEADAEEVWKAVASATGDAVSLNATLGEVQEQP